MADKWQQMAFVALLVASIFGILSFCLSAASVGLSRAPDEGDIVAQNVEILSKYRAMESSSIIVSVPAYDLQTANGMKQISESIFNFTVYFGMSSIGTYTSERYKNEDKTVFGFTPFLPCNYVNDTEPTLVYLTRRRLDTANDLTTIQSFNPCSNGVADTCEEVYQSVYAHFATSLVFALFAMPLQFYRASIIKQNDSFLVFCVVTLAWILVFTLMAAGAGHFYSRCVEPTVKFLEGEFAPFGGIFIRSYGPVTNIAISSSFFASMCMLINLLFFYRSPGKSDEDGGALASKGEEDSRPRDSSRLSLQISVTPKVKVPAECDIRTV